MRNIILGILVASCGAAALIVDLTGGTPHRSGAYGAGQTAGLVFLVLMIFIGIRAIHNGLRDRTRQPR